MQKHKQAFQGLWASAGLKIPIHAHFLRAVLTRKVGQTDLLVVYYESSSVVLCMQDYQSLCAAIMICATVVEPKSDFFTFWPRAIEK